MKILRISLRNLASLAGTHTVDFTREPLRSAGLFSISGPTGSGKSTLLDALCLALYEKTPRLASASGEQIPDGAATATLTPRDPGNLLRRGATEGFSEVAFVGVDGLVYTARWSIRRARNRPDGNLQGSEMVLLSGDRVHPDAGHIAVGGKKSEVLAAIIEKVGLTFPQFTRAVLLAQNDFAVFLKAGDQERAAILEALTGTERFAVISRLAFERHKKEREAVLALENKLAGAVPLDAEARAAAETEQIAAASLLASTETSLTAVLQHLRWFEQDHGLAAACEKSAAAVVTARAAVETSAPREADRDLTERLLHVIRPLHDSEQLATRQLAAARDNMVEAERRHATANTTFATRREAQVAATAAAAQAVRALAEAQPVLQSARLLDSQLEAIAPRLASAAAARGAADSAKLAAEKSLQDLRDQIAARDTELAAFSARQIALVLLAPFVDDLAAWRDRIAAAQTARSALADRIGESDTFARRSATLRVEVEKNRAAAAELKRALDQAVAENEAAGKTARAFDPEILATRRAGLDAGQGALIALQTHHTRLADLAARHQAASAELARLGTVRADDTAALDEIVRTRLPSAAAVLAASQAMLKRLEAAADQAVPRLRSSLVAEQPCPVCGSLHHPDAQSPHVDESTALRAIREQVAAHQSQHDEIRTAQTRHQTALTLAEKQHAAQRATADQLAVELENTRAKRPADPALASLLALPEPDQPEALAAALASFARNREEHLRQESAQRAAALAATESVRKLEAARAAHDKAAQILSAGQTEFAGAEAESTAAKAQREAAAHAHADRLAALAPIFQQLPDARAGFEQDAPAFATSFAASADSLQRLRRQIDEATTLRDQDLARRPGREEALASTTQTLAATTATDNALREERTCLQENRQALFAGCPAATVQAELENALATAKTTHETRAGELSEAAQSAAAANESVTSQRAAHEAAIGALAAARLALDQALAAFVTPKGEAFDRVEFAPYLARDAAWLAGERNALTALRDVLNTAGGQHQAHAVALANHRAQPPTTDLEDTVRGHHAARLAELAAAKERHLAAATALAADEQRRRDAAGLLRQIEARRAVAAPWGRLDELIGSADGAKFRAIVQRHALDILLGHANAQLDLVSARYRLERLPDSLNLIVRDRDMADERRSVHSLSGGESFLVSLSLALGLASLTSNRLRIESLFIDEGFGSLDPATLEIAMNALMRLESQGRKVGVISHVTEMADAIPVQIRVVKGRGGVSRLEVPGAAPVASAAGAGDVATPLVDAPPSDTAIDALAATLLDLLQAAELAGEGTVSIVSLRKKLGCEPRAFDAVRARLGGRIIATGRSLALSPVGAAQTTHP